MPEPVVSPPLTLVRNDWRKIGKGALLALAGCGAAIATETVAEIDFGSWTAPVAAVWSIGFNLLRKWIPAGH